MTLNNIFMSILIILTIKTLPLSYCSMLYNYTEPPNSCHIKNLVVPLGGFNCIMESTCWSLYQRTSPDSTSVFSEPKQIASRRFKMLNSPQITSAADSLIMMNIGILIIKIVIHHKAMGNKLKSFQE